MEAHQSANDIPHMSTLRQIGELDPSPSIFCRRHVVASLAGADEFDLAGEVAEVTFGGGGGDFKVFFQVGAAEFAAFGEFFEEPVLAVGRGLPGFDLGFCRCLVRLILHGQAGVELVAGVAPHDEGIIGRFDAVSRQQADGFPAKRADRIAHGVLTPSQAKQIGDSFAGICLGLAIGFAFLEQDKNPPNRPIVGVADLQIVEFDPVGEIPQGGIPEFLEFRDIGARDR